MTRVLILCTHNSAPEPDGRGVVRHYAHERGIELDVHYAGTEGTRVKPEAVEVMREVGIDLSDHSSKTLYDLPDPWNFDVVVTVCDSTSEACPAYPVQTTRLHVSFPDPSGHDLARWREVRDAPRAMSKTLVKALVAGQTPIEAALRRAAQLEKDA